MPKATSTDASAGGKTPCTSEDLTRCLKQLRDQKTAAEAVRALAKLALSAEDGAAIRLDGGLPLLLQQLNSIAEDADLIAAMTVIQEIGWCDPPSRDAFVLQGVVRKLVPFVVHSNRDVVMSALDCLEPYLWDGDLHLRNLEVFRSGTEEFFRCGGVARILRYLDTAEPRKDICLAVSEILGHLGDRVYNRERLRDMGTISLMHNVVNMPMEPAMKEDWLMTSVSFLSNMARSDFTHTTMRDCNVLEMAEEVIGTTTLESNKMFALMLVAHVYGNDDQNHRCLSLLEEHDVSRLVVQLLDTTKNGDGLYKDIPIPTEEATHAARSLSRERKNAGRLAKGGAVPLLLEILCGPQTSKDTQAVYNCLLTLANMSIYLELRKPLQEAGVVQVVTQLENNTDLRIADSAKTILMNLSKLHDDSVTRAHAALTGGADDFKHKYEVFLSHKRTDAKDFARALYNLFVLRGVSCFLDFEYREELGDLGTIVANSLNLIFVLTDNVFESKWCMKELQAAVESQVNIILIVKDGSRWKDSDGNPTCEFPPYDLIKTLPEQVQPVFTRKSIAHSDEYYQAFVDTLIKKVIRQAKTPETVPSNNSNNFMEVPQATSCNNGSGGINASSGVSNGIIYQQGGNGMVGVNGSGGESAATAAQAAFSGSSTGSGRGCTPTVLPTPRAPLGAASTLQAPQWQQVSFGPSTSLQPPSLPSLMTDQQHHPLGFPLPQGRVGGFPQHAMWPPPPQAYHHPQQIHSAQSSAELLADISLALRSELSLLRNNLVAEMRQAQREMLSEVASSIRALHQDMALQLRQVQQDVAAMMQQQCRDMATQAMESAAATAGISSQLSQTGRHLANLEHVLQDTVASMERLGVSVATDTTTQQHQQLAVAGQHDLRQLGRRISELPTSGGARSDSELPRLIHRGRPGRL